MSEDPTVTIARLEARLERLKRNMLSSDSRPRLIAGAVAMAAARSDREFAEAFLEAMDKGQDRMVDRRSISDFVEELETKWDLRDRSSVDPALRQMA